MALGWLQIAVVDAPLPTVAHCPVCLTERCDVVRGVALDGGQVVACCGCRGADYPCEPCYDHRRPWPAEAAPWHQ